MQGHFDFGALTVHLECLLFEAHLVRRIDGQRAHVSRSHVRPKEECGDVE
jgi:hypothetical protein